jgi:hypothetical protein
MHMTAWQGGSTIAPMGIDVTTEVVIARCGVCVRAGQRHRVVREHRGRRVEDRQATRVGSRLAFVAVRRANRKDLARLK